MVLTSILSRNFFFSTTLLLIAFFSYAQQTITSSITSGYDPVETSPELSEKISKMFGNEKIQTKFFQILGELGVIKLDKGVIYSKLSFEEEYAEGGLDLKVVRVFTGYEDGQRRQYVGLAGKVGSIDLSLEIDFQPGLMAITSATVGEPKEILPAKLSIVNTSNDKILFEYEWAFENVPLANWVENRMDIPNANDFVSEYIKERYKEHINEISYNIEVKKSYVLLKERPTSGIILEANLEIGNVSQFESFQTVLLFVYQKRNQERYSNRVSDWHISNMLNNFGKLLNVSFKPSDVGDIMITLDNNGMRATEVKAFSIYKFNFKQDNKIKYFEPVLLYDESHAYSMEKENIDFEFDINERGIMVNTKFYERKSYDDKTWSLIDNKNQVIDFYNELNKL